jgi:hypothetical protein
MYFHTMNLYTPVSRVGFPRIPAPTLSVSLAVTLAQVTSHGSIVWERNGGVLFSLY